MTVLCRQELYDRVWTDPVRTVAQELGVSDVGLKKACARADIPVPERGYWAKVKAGRSPRKTDLPLRGPGAPDDVHIGEHDRFGTFRGSLEEELARPAPVAPHFEEALDDVRQRIAAIVGKVSADRTLRSPHPLIRDILAEQEKRQAVGRLRGWDAPGAADFSSAFERRRLRVLSSLFNALAKFGARPWIHDAEARRTGAVVGTMSVDFVLDHPKAKPDQAGRWRTREGWADELRLSLTGDQSRVWRDSEEHGLEAHLTDIVVQLITEGERRYRAAVVTSYEQALARRRQSEAELARRREDAARQARQAAIAAEKERRSQLLSLAADLRAADDIRALVARVLARRPAGDDAASRWGAWALTVAEQLDPTGWDVFGPAESEPAAASGEA